MKKLFLFLLCAACIIMLASCAVPNDAGEERDTEHQIASQVPEPTESPATTAEPESVGEPIESIEIYSAKMWNEFSRLYNDEREKYADFVTVEIMLPLDFTDIAFVPLTGGFSGKITTGESELSEMEIAEQHKEWIENRKIWPQDYNGTFINITDLEEVNGKAPNSLFGSVGELELVNVSFALIYLDEAECLLAESADSLRLRNVSVQNCLLPHGRCILAENAGAVSVEMFTAESCFLTGYEYMAGLVPSVSGDAEFKDIFICRSSFILSPDNGGSGLWSAGIGVLAKQIGGTASFENIDLYACTTNGLHTNALTGSAGNVSKCSNISMDHCTFINYRPMTSAFNSGLISSCGEVELMEMPIFEENVSMTNCNIGGEYTADDFIARGYRVENCIFTSATENPPQ